MRYQGNDLIYFDIETAGFSAIKDDFILSETLKGEEYIEHQSLEGLSEFAEKNGFNGIIVTCNGEHYRGGFDFPFLRTKYALERKKFPFSGMMHLDILPLLRKYINTTDYQIKIPSKSSSKMNKKNLTKLAFANGLEYKTINETYEELMKLHEEGKCNWLDFASIKSSEDNSLQKVYQIFFDPAAEEDYIDGSEIPELYKEGNIDPIAYHCKNDVKRLKDVTELLLDMVPSWEVERAISRL
jgi:hypothetical protein